ncbi:hypothetical protein ABZ726_01575 [Streptomyces hundungensis]|uniref:hypothetical protein n=1 Tax=Streptomyces hundungensis TaxID=1077946 RepID=UPI003410C621
MNVSAQSEMADDGRPTDLDRVAPYGWDADDPTWAERYVVAPDLEHPLVRDEPDEITAQPGETTIRTTPPWRCPSCGCMNAGYAVEVAFARTSNGQPVTLAWGTAAAACLVTMSGCGHAFRAVPAAEAGQESDR